MFATVMLQLLLLLRPSLL